MTPLVYRKETEFQEAIVNEPIDPESLIELDDQLFLALEESSDDLVVALGSVLGIQDTQNALYESQKVAEIADDTDLKAETEFDLSEFLEQRGIENPYADKGSNMNDIPQVILANALDKIYSVPVRHEIKVDGSMKMSFSNAIYEPSFSNTLYYLEQD